jgi:hypothetical protein
MKMPEMLDALRIEVQDTDKAIWDDVELIRAIDKSVSLMSRLIPKRAIVEAKIKVTITGETLTIASSTGTLAYKPAQYGTVEISDKTLDTDYTVNYLTGVITEVGSSLTDGSYTVSYSIDPYILDISTILSDYIRIERVEYPVGNQPPSFITPLQEVFATYMVFKDTLTEDKSIRITYLTYWTSPTATSNGDFPRSLDNAILIGSAGQALIFKAEKYVQSAVNAMTTLTVPTDFGIVLPSSPSLPTAPTAPTAPSLSFTDVSAAITAISTEITAAKGHITSGETVINTSNPGQNVSENYGNYAKAVFDAANTRVQEALVQLRIQEDNIQKYSSQVTAYGSAVNAYANEISGLSGVYREDINSQGTGVAEFSARVNKYTAQVNEQQMKVTNWLNIAGRFLASGQAKINEMLVMLGQKAEYNMYKTSPEQFS